MNLNNSFLVPAAKDVAWETLLDVPAMVACMPGATLVGAVDDATYKTEMKVKFGPIGLTFASDVHQEDTDRDAGRVVLRAKARESKGRGGAQAKIVSTLTEVDEGTRVDIVTDLQLSGPVAQYGRGMVEDLSADLVGRFAGNLRQHLAATAPQAAGSAPAADTLSSTPPEAPTASRVAATAPAAPAAPARPAAARPISGLRLTLRMLRRSLRRWLRR